jgi:hypothetical protein
MNKLCAIHNHMPLDNRTHEFHVSVFPTTHSDKLQLKGQYILKVTETEMHLFTASGALPSQFWSPLGCVRKAHHYVLPAQQIGMVGGALGGANGVTRNLLVITTEGTSPIGEGGFTFFSESAKDIAATITHRRDMRIKARSACVSPLVEEDDRGVPTGSTKKTPPLKRKRVQGMKSLPISPTTEREDFCFKGNAAGKAGAETGRKEPEQGSGRVCVRMNRVIPISHQLEKSRSQKRLQLNLKPDSIDSLLSPEEPHYVTNTSLAGHQKKFYEWKEDRLKQLQQQQQEAGRHPHTGGEDGSETSQGGGERGTIGRERRQQWTEGRHSTVSMPERGDWSSSSVSSLEGEYVSICRLDCAGESCSERSTSDADESSLDRRTRGLERQVKIDVVSPAEQRELLGMRPRTNAFSETSPTQKQSGQLPWRREDGGTVGRGAGRERGLQCNGEVCVLVPRKPALASIPQKSGSDPVLSRHTDFDLTTSQEYLTILPWDGLPKKTPKKPVPTPRTHKPPPQSLPLYENTIHAMPPTLTITSPTTAGQMSPSSSKTRLDVRALLSSQQRSLSEITLYSSTAGGGSLDEDDQYVDMTQFQRQLLQPLYENCDGMTHYNYGLRPCDPEVTFRGGLQRQRSSSMGDIPTNHSSQGPPHIYENSRACVASFMETEDIYENGPHVMEYYLYGKTPFSSGSYGNETTTKLCNYGDSGLGSTPSCSPLLGQRSFSLDDVRRGGSNRAWETPRDHQVVATKKAADQVRYRLYVNLPPLEQSY